MTKEAGLVYGLILKPANKEQQDIYIDFKSKKDRLLFLDLLNRSNTNANVSFYEQ